ncbi:flagellar basal body-associated FliL family protein [Desulfotomaculum copahuensis]|uniref:Flagellar protein FliL n=1 Tax=Desulfotomaculum copahuensis TaxID=1838280 RepID=A0A1B7LBL1_9FIRM|nr:flagellar basal body-associated FliL family protein [Desulfotomaculum copahuensis]OAT79927.1 hypothetical protein A6M21_14565 [Desulfotomaculum copahuensis]
MPPIKKLPNGENNGKKEKGGGLRTFMLVLLAVLLGGGLTFGALRYTGVLSGKPAQATPVEQSMDTLDLGSKVLNLADAGPSHFLRVDVVLAYPSGDKALADELKAKQPQVTEAMLTVLRGMTSQQVLPVKNQDSIKQQILQAVNAQLIHGKVAGLYFTDFLVQ